MTFAPNSARPIFYRILENPTGKRRGVNPVFNGVLITILLLNGPLTTENSTPPGGAYGV